MMDKKTIEITVNGARHKLSVDPDQPLLNVLRYELKLTGTKYGCAEGQCGTCTVLMDGSPVRSCLLPVADIAGHSVETIESLARGNQLDPIQEAFLEHQAFQCGYCTPGQIMAAKGLLTRNPDPTPVEIQEAMQGNLCRCGTYSRIVRAIRTAAMASKKSD